MPHTMLEHVVVNSDEILTTGLAAGQAGTLGRSRAPSLLLRRICPLCVVLNPQGSTKSESGTVQESTGQRATTTRWS